MDQSELHGVLVRARGIQAQRGHSKRILWSPTGVCMAGALMIAVNNGAEVYHNMTQVEVAARALAFNNSMEMCRWNNVVERTLDDVLARFDKGIKATAPEPTPEPTPEPERELVAA